MTSNRSNSQLSTMSSSMHLDVEANDYEMFSGAVSNAVPTSVSTFHHHNHHKSPSLSITSIDNIDQYRIDQINLDPHSVELTRQKSRNTESNYKKNKYKDENLLDEDSDGYESEASGFQERSNFRFFKTEEIEAAKGVSSLGGKLSVFENTIDYDKNWNSFVDDYNDYNDENYESDSNRKYSVSSTTRLTPDINDQIESDLNNNRNANGSSLNSYGSADNTYSEFFRNTAERELIADDEEQNLTYDNTEGDEDIVTQKKWLKILKNREAIKMHDKFFKKFPATNHSQRFYIAEEDLVVGIAGYQTTWTKLIIYRIICIFTFGLYALLCRWIPKWKIRMMGKKVPLGKAQWLVVEDEYGTLEIPNVDRKWYNRNLSTFLSPRKVEHFHEENENNINNRENESDESSKYNVESIKTDISKTYTIDDIDPIVPVLISFEYRYMRLFYDPLDDLFKISNNWIDEKWRHYPDIKEGITENNYKCRKTIFGKNLIEIKDKTIGNLLIDEILHPFYVFQIFSIFLWLADDYYYYAFCIFLISILSISESLIETRSTFQRMRKMSKFECDVRVWRNGFWKEINSDDLVPGDIYEVSDPSLSIFPCDSILLTGDCIVNEAMLTGESVPVSKVSVTADCIKDLEHEFDSPKFSNKFSKSFLYNGTKIVRVRYGQSQESCGNEPATALVIRTGFNTTKGALVRSMLFPKPTGFKFYEDSFKYIGFMSMIACFGFIFSTINFLRLGLGWKIILLRALDLITIVVPPALPATLTIGTNFALNRLRQKNIFCIAPMRVNIGGKLDIMCFDKTGTLTEEGLNIMGIHVSNPIRDRKEHEFSEIFKTIEGVEKSNFKNSAKIFTSMLTCHSLKIINDVPIGDPLDENMFDFVGWNMIESASENPLLENFINSRAILTSTSPILFTNNTSSNYWIQLKEFEFISQLRRMSTISIKLSTNEDVKNEEIEVFVKGAPEVIETICKPETIPSNFNELLHHYTHNGYRIIACATKTLSNPNKNSKDLSFIGDLERDVIESDLDFIGFIVFENCVKPSTTPTIDQLIDANIRNVICTGDNVLTAINVGKECHIISENTRVYIPSFDYDSLPNQFDENVDHEISVIPPIIWTDVDNPENELDRLTLAPLGIDQDNDYCLAITGDVFKFILTELYDMEFLIENMLSRGTIFARMSPDEKHELVNQLQKIDYTVGFCGDGANDCGALKAADVGISLSEAEASVAAPFTSRIFEISCVLDVIKEGRASLVTSFSCFQYMSLYSAIQFITVSILYKEGSNLGDFQFLYIDLALIIPIAIFMSWSKPYDKICKKKPTANLISPKIIIPLLGNISLLLAGQFITWSLVKYLKFPWYIKPIPGNDDEVASTDNTVLFFYSNFQYILIALMLTVGPPYREPATKNFPFIFTIITTLFVSMMMMTINPESWLGNLLNLTWISGGVKISIILGVLVNYGILEIGDKYIFLGVARLYKRTFKKSGSSKKFKKLKKEFRTVV